MVFTTIYTQAQEKIATNTYVYGDLKNSMNGKVLVRYLIDDPKHNVQKIEDQFLHTQFFALVDKNGKVRGQIYDGLKADELEKLKIDIRALLIEKASSSNFVNGIFSNNP